MTTWLRTRLVDLARDETGTVTVEYALAVVIAATLSGVLIAVVTSDSVNSAIESIVQSALSG